MSERLSKTVTLKRGDVYVEKSTAIDTGEPIVQLLKVADVNTDQGGNDYLWSDYALSAGGVPSSTTMYLEDGKKVGRTAVVPVEEVDTKGRVTTREKIKAPKGTKWSYGR